MNTLGRRIVVDANVAVKWLIAEPDSAKARKVPVGRELLAPDLMLLQCASICWKRVRLGEMNAAEARVALAFLQDAPVRWTRDADLAAEAQRLANKLDHPIYDCVYLALALTHTIPVVTADRRFAALARKAPALQTVLVPLDSLPDLA